MTKYIPDSVIDEIRDRNDIVSVVSDYVSLKKTGKNHVGLCPFHQEKTPSFSVSTDKQIFYCFGCGSGGNVFTFLMRHEQMEFPEAVEYLARKVGVQIPKKSRTSIWVDPNESLYHANAFAADYFHRMLVEDNSGKIALEYFEKRGISKHTIDKFNLGYALDKWDGLLLVAKRQGISEELLLRAGLIVKRENGDGFYDRFRDRVIFPINNLSGKPVAFGGRILEVGEPKYLNSPETPIYHKGSFLYGLDLAKSAIRSEGKAIVVEGYMDLLVLSQKGIEYAVAPLGTALTSDQALLLRRYTKVVYLIYDSDEAGLKATFRGGDELLKVGASVKVVSIPDGEDPDSFIRKAGKEKFLVQVNHAVDFIDRKLEILQDKVDLSDVDGKRRAIGHLLDSVNLVSDKLTKQLYMERITDRLNVPMNLLQREAAKLIGGRRVSSRAILAMEQQPKSEVWRERYVLELMLKDRDVFEFVVDEISAEDFTREDYRKIFNLLTEFGVRSESELRNLLFSRLDPEMHSVLSQLYLAPEEFFENKEKIIEDCLRDIRQRQLKKNREGLKERVKAAHAAGDEEKEQELMRDIALTKKSIS